MGNSPNIDRVAEHVVEMPAAEGSAIAILPCPRSGSARPPAAIDLLLHLPHSSVLEVQPEQSPHGFRFLLLDPERPTVRLIAERDKASHPHALLLRRGDLVADTLPRDFALE